MIRGYLTLLGSERATMIRYLIWVFIYGLFQGLSMLLLVPVTRALFDGDFAAAGRWILVLVPVVAVCCITYYTQAMRAMRMAVHAMGAMHHRLGDHLVTLPLGWFSRERAGEVSQVAVKGTMFVGSTGAHLISPVVANLTSSGTVVIGLFFFEWRIGLAAVVGAVLLWLIGGYAGRIIADAEGRNRATAVEVNHRILEFARYQPVLRAFGRSGSKYAPLDAAFADQRVVAKQVMWKSVLGVFINGFAVQLVFTIILAVGAWLAIAGQVEPAVLVAVFGLAARFTDPVSELADLGSALRMSRREIGRIASILDTPAMTAPSEPSVPTTSGSLEFRDVSFGYDAETPVVRGVSFAVPAGSMTAIVGPSGSGKTTLTRLAARFYDVDEGAVLVGGVDVRDQDTAVLMEQLSLVFQDVYLFDDTLRENIRIGRPNATDAEVDAAAETAGVLPIIDRLADGWHTSVGEGGSALSGGERQRVSIARALLKNAPVVLFDEATSALDPENEAHVADSIRALAQDSTVVVIAHKLSTVIAADQIVVLDDEGRVAATGTHDELLAAGGQYADFWTQRTAAVGWVMAQD